MDLFFGMLGILVFLYIYDSHYFGWAFGQFMHGFSLGKNSGKYQAGDGSNSDGPSSKVLTVVAIVIGFMLGSFLTNKAWSQTNPWIMTIQVCVDYPVTEKPCRCQVQRGPLPYPTEDICIAQGVPAQAAVVMGHRMRGDWEANIMTALYCTRKGIKIDLVDRRRDCSLHDNDGNPIEWPPKKQAPILKTQLK